MFSYALALTLQSPPPPFFLPISPHHHPYTPTPKPVCFRPTPRHGARLSIYARNEFAKTERDEEEVVQVLETKGGEGYGYGGAA